MHNIIFRFLFDVLITERELRTPPLDTTILPGITRTSILELSREWNEFNVVESPITFKELRHLLDNNRVSSHTMHGRDGC